MKRLWLMLAVFMATGVAQAAYYDFVGGYSSNDWNDPNNWVTLTSIFSPRSSGTPAVLAPTSADQVVVRDNVTATVNTGYQAVMGTTQNTPNGVGAAEYRDVSDPNLGMLWASPAKVVLVDGQLTQVLAKQSGLYIVGGVYGGTLEIKGGSFSPDQYLYIGSGGNYTYDGMRIDDPNSADPNDTLQDPNYVGITNVGYVYMSGGTFVPTYVNPDGTKTRVKVGYAGGEGTFIMTNGTVCTNERPMSPQFVIAEGTGAEHATAGATKGYMEMSGGSMRLSENIQVGYRGGKAKMVMTGGSINHNGDLQIAANSDHANPYWATADGQATGDVTVGGSATWHGVGKLNMGWMNARATLTVKDNALFQYTSPDSGLANNNAIGRSVVYNGGSVSGNGVGVINVQGGSFQFKPSQSNTTMGTIRLGWTWDNRTQTAKDPNLALAGVYSRGELNQTGGVVLFEAGGTVADSTQYIVLGSSYNNQANNHSTGIVSVTGGTFKTVGTTTAVYDPEDPNVIIGYARAPVHMILAQNKDTTGRVTIGRNAYFSVDGDFSMAPGSETGAVASLTVDFDSTKVGKLNLTGVATLAGTLTVNTAGYRPREDDTMVIITSTDPNATYFSGDFSAIATNITLGQQGASPFWSGSKVNGNYVLKFDGLTAGDANGDGSVDGGDLALMGGNWGGAGKTWGGGDFTGEGGVDGGDLSLIGGNWGYTATRPGPEAPLPEPATLALLALGGLAVIRRKR
jgi:hypothetical protein